MSTDSDTGVYSLALAERTLSGNALLHLMRAVLARDKPFRFRARGGSMAPFIRDGDIIRIAPLTRPPRVGEVVAFMHPRTRALTVHRLVARRGVAHLAQGDNAPERADGFLRPRQILGRVARVDRNGRQVRFGLGPERRLIAELSRRGWLTPLCRAAGRAKARAMGGVSD